MKWKLSYDEKSSKETLMEALTEIMSLDNDYPEIGAPIVVRQLLADGHFDAESEPWDFLILIGYVMNLLRSDYKMSSYGKIRKIVVKMEWVLRRPKKWMYDAITEDVQRRYFEVAGVNIPQGWYGVARKPRNMVIIVRQTWEQLMYVIHNYCFASYILYSPEDQLDENDELDDYGGVTVREVRDLVASMKNPPQYILDELTKQAIEVEREELGYKLALAQKWTKKLALMGYTPNSLDEVEIKLLKKITDNLGYEANFTVKTAQKKEQNEKKEDEQ